MCAKAEECQLSASMISTLTPNSSPGTGAWRLFAGHDSTRTSPSSGRAERAEISSALVIRNAELNQF